MLSTLLNNIVSSFSKAFLIASFLPVLAFTFVNGTIAYALFDPWRQWCDKHLLGSAGLGQLVFITGVFAIALVIMAYLIASITNFLRRLMEGKWFSWIAYIFTPAQGRRLSRLDRMIEEAVKVKSGLEASARFFQGIMSDAAKDETKKLMNFEGSAELANAIDELKLMRSQNRLLKPEPLDSTLAKFSSCLNAGLPYKKASTVRPLFLCRTEIYDLIAFSTDQTVLEYERLQNERNSSFGTYLAPTRMGNIANSIQAYAERRYHCNLDSVISNLLWCVDQNAKGNTSMQDAKTQLDFLIISSYLSMLWTAIWMVILGALHSSVWFIFVALAGPLASYCWYLAASEQYRAFNDVLSTSFDIYRFDLLKALHMPIPGDVDEERQIWGELDKLADIEGGERHNFRYETARS